MYTMKPKIMLSEKKSFRLPIVWAALAELATLRAGATSVELYKRGILSVLKESLALGLITDSEIKLTVAIYGYTPTWLANLYEMEEEGEEGEESDEIEGED